MCTKCATSVDDSGLCDDNDLTTGYRGLLDTLCIASLSCILVSELLRQDGVFDISIGQRAVLEQRHPAMMLHGSSEQFVATWLMLLLSRHRFAVHVYKFFLTSFLTSSLASLAAPAASPSFLLTVCRAESAVSAAELAAFLTSLSVGVFLAEGHRRSASVSLLIPIETGGCTHRQSSWRPRWPRQQSPDRQLVSVRLSC